MLHTKVFVWSATVSQRTALTEADACDEPNACAELKDCAEPKDCDDQIPVVVAESDEVEESEICVGTGICTEITSVSITPPSRLVLRSSTDSDSSATSGKS